MPASIVCDNCGKKLKAGPHLAGKRVKCPGCESIFQVPQNVAEQEQPASESTASATDGDELNWDRLDLSDRSQVEDTSRPPPVVPKTVRLTDDEDGTLVKPRLRREPTEDDEPASHPAKSPRRKTPRIETVSHDEFHWRDQLHWLLALALIPLAISLLSNDDHLRDEIIRLIQEHPELENARTKEDLFRVLPEGKLAGAHLVHDSSLHWLYAVLSAALFLGLLALMFPGAKAGVLVMFGAGLATGTIGIAMLLLLQLIATSTRGVMPRGRGWGILIFLIIKFIGFSYYCALDPDNGFLLSFLGFTCGVGLCEELCKALPIVIYLNSGRETDWRGASLVGLASGVGFGVSEGITYAGDSYNGLAPLLTYLVRFLSCVTLHAVWAGSVALQMERNQDYIDDWEWENAALFVIHYLGVAMILHGLYDTLLKKEYQSLALVVAIASFGWWAWQLRQAKEAG